MVVHLSVEDVDLAISLLTRLKEASVDGGMDSRTFWQSFNPTKAQVRLSIHTSSEDSAPLTCTTVAIPTLGQNLQKIKGVMEPVLNAVDVVMKEALLNTQDALLSEGLRRLPNEVLASIFYWSSLPGLYEDSVYQTTIYQLMRLSHVCCRFRTVILSSPSLCASLDTRVPLPLLSVFIDRAGVVPFTVLLSPQPSSKRGDIAKEVLDLIMRQHTRWRDVFIQINNWSSPLARALQNSGGFHLPSLRHVCFCDCIFDAIDDSRHATTDFLSTWQYPATVHIEREFSSQAIINPSILSATHVTVDMREPSSVASFIKDLGRMNRMERLEIWCDDPLFNKTPRLTQGSRVDSLPKLTNLTLRVWDRTPQTSSHDISNSHDTSLLGELQAVVMNFIDIVNLLPVWRLSTLTIGVSIRAFQRMLDHVGVLDSLEKLDLQLSSEFLLRQNADYCHDIVMEKWCSVLPNLKSIAFTRWLPQAEYWISPTTGEFAFKGLSGLREIAITSCYYFKLEEKKILSPSHVVEVIAEAWAAATGPGSSTTKSIVVSNDLEPDRGAEKRIRKLGVDISWS